MYYNLRLKNFIRLLKNVYYPMCESAKNTKKSSGVSIKERMNNLQNSITSVKYISS